MPSKPTGHTTGLVLQGGGARGAYQVGALKAIAEILGQSQNPFPVISGASVGAINAASMAAAANNFPLGVKNLESLWRGLHCSSVYKTGFGAISASSARWFWTIAFSSFGVGGPCAFLDNRPLSELLESQLDRDGIGQAIADGNLDAVGITASSYSQGRAITFFEAREDIKEWTRSRRSGVRTKLQVDHLMASSSLPFIFMAVNIDGSYYGDGSLRLTSPLSPAINMGADRLFVIGVRDNSISEKNQDQDEEYPSIGAMGGHALDILFNDDLDADIERLTRINSTLKHLTPEGHDKVNLKFIDVMTLTPSRDLRDVAHDHAQEMPATMRMLLRSVGAWGSDTRLVSYLLFEPGYIGALIDLGYGDTVKKTDEIKEFLLN